MKHEPLDQTNPENRCNVDGVEYVACANAQMTCFACVAPPGSRFCRNLGECSITRNDMRSIYWRPASEFGPSEADRLREQVKTLREVLKMYSRCFERWEITNTTDKDCAEMIYMAATDALESTKEHE